MARWAEDDGCGVVRVNAAGVIAKTRTDLVEQVPLILSRDAEARHLYVTAVVSRIGDHVGALARELRNPRDAGARWCAAHLLAQRGGHDARTALMDALHREPVRENIRSYALMLSGEHPCT